MSTGSKFRNISEVETETANMLNIKELTTKYKDEATHLLSNELEFLFLETSSYVTALSSSSPFYIFRGEKGSGKSMIFRRLIQEKRKQTIGIYFWEFYDEIINRVIEHHPANDKAINEVLFFQEEWLIQFWIQLAKKLYDLNWEKRRAPFDTGSYAEIYKFLKKHRLLTRLNWVGKIVAAFDFRPEKAKIKHGDTEIDLTFVKPIKAKIMSIEEVTIIQHVIDLLQRTPIYLIVDEVDVIGVWKDSTKAQLQGLYNAAFNLIRSVNMDNQDANNTSQPKEQPLRIRIALREDMFIASNEGYVDNEKLTNESISLAWTPDTLKEIVARPIRSHWGFAAQEISKEKLLSEIFPDHLSDSAETFNKFAQWAKGNPRALNKLIREILATSIRRQETYLDKTLFEPLSVSVDDIYSTILNFSNERLNFLRQSYQFMFPRLNDIINFLKNDSKTFFPDDGCGFYATLENKLALYFIEHKEILQDVNKWGGVRTGQMEEIISCLYITGLIGVVKEITKEETYLPTPFMKTEKIVLAPMYRPTILGYTHPVTTTAQIDHIQKNLDFLVSTIDLIRKTIGSPTGTAIQAMPASKYGPRSIRYQFSCLFWGMRSLKKGLITYGDLLNNCKSIDVHKTLVVIQDTYDELSSLIEIDVKAMETLSILMNMSSTEPLSEELFRSSLDEAMDSIYLKSIEPINELIGNLANKGFYINFTPNFENALNILRVNISDIDTTKI